MTPCLETLRNVATFKCVLLRWPVQSAEFRGFMMDSEFFPGVIPLSLILFEIIEILRPGRGGAGPGLVGGQWGELMARTVIEGARLRE